MMNKEGVHYKKIKKVRDPKGYLVVDLKKRSYIQDIIHDYKKLEITDYGIGTVAKHHNPQKNEYLIPKTILDADVFINVPKMKTHKKAGVTLSMKNLIGINGDKSWIAHHRRGVDEFPKINIKDFSRWKVVYYLKAILSSKSLTLIKKIYRLIFNKKDSKKIKTILMEGNWHGNDTVWRSILDLNNIIFFTDKKGLIKNNQQRKYFTLIDGIIGMEGEGPMHGYPKKSNILIGGFHPVAVDFVAAYIMGFDYKKIPTIRESLFEKYFNLTNFKTSDIFVKSNDSDWSYINLKFKASSGWVNEIERHNN